MQQTLNVKSVRSGFASLGKGTASVIIIHDVNNEYYDDSCFAEK